MRYLDYFRSLVIAKLEGLNEADLRGSRLPSGWAPIELLKHLTYVETRWLVWGFAGEPVDDPWGDRRDGHWVATESLASLVRAANDQAQRTRQIVASHYLSDVGQPGER